MGEVLGDPWLAAAVLGVVVLGALAQGVTGMGFSLVAAPALIAVAGQQEGVATVVVLAAGSSLVPLARGWRNVRVGDGSRLLVPILLATPVVGWALRGLDHDVLAAMGGLGVLLGVGALAYGLRSTWLLRPVGAAVAGVVSAVLNVVGGVGGPPLGLYAANSTWTPPQTRSTLHAIFLAQNLLTAWVVGFVLPGWQLLVALVVGSLLGLVLAPRLSPRVTRWAILGVSAFGGASLLLGAL